MLSDTDYELWLFSTTKTGGSKIVVRLREDSSETLSELSYKAYDFPADKYKKTFLLTGGKQKVNNSKTRQFRRCRWEAA